MVDIVNTQWCFSAGSVIAFCLVTILLHFVIAGYSIQLKYHERFQHLNGKRLQ
jgi:hypothetical protein